MKKLNTMSLAFLAIGLLLLSSGAFATTQINLQGNDSNVTTTPTVTAKYATATYSPYPTATKTVTKTPNMTVTPNMTETPNQTTTIQPTVTEMAITPIKTVAIETVSPTKAATPIPTPKSPGFEIVTAIFVLSAIYILGRRR